MFPIRPFSTGNNDTPTSGIVTATTDMTIGVTLYQYSGTGTPSSADDLEEFGTGTARFSNSGSNTTAKWTIPIFGTDENGNEFKYKYYIKEDLDDISGQTANTGDFEFGSVDTSLQGTVVTIGEGEAAESYVEIDFTTLKSVYETRLYNYQQAIPVHVVKRNANTNATSIDGCQVTVYTDSACTRRGVPGGLRHRAQRQRLRV